MLSASLSGEYLIHEAAMSCDLYIIKLLLQNNPKLLEQRDARGQTPLLCVITRSTGHEQDKRDVINYLISQGADVNVVIECPDDPFHEKTALQYAREQKQSYVVTTLIQAGAPDTSLNGEYLIHEAAINCDIYMAKLLLQYNPELLEQRDARGQTPLLCVITRSTGREQDKRDVINYLISQGANVNVVIECPDDPFHEKTALQYAREQKQSYVVTTLIQAGAQDAPLILNNLQNNNSQAKLLQDKISISNASTTIFYKKPKRLEYTEQEFSWTKDW